MIDSTPDCRTDLIEQIPDPETVRKWLADSIRRCDLLRSLLRLAVRKASYRRALPQETQEVRDE
jgi:hypothetical protein